MEVKDEKLNIEEVQKVTSKLHCVNDFLPDLGEREKLEKQLNSMFGQWFEGD